MSHRKSPSRRAILGGGIAAMALPILAPMLGAQACSSEFRSLCGMAGRFFSSAGSAAEIGRAYLALTADEASPDALAARLLEGRGDLAEAIGRAEYDGFVSALRSAVRADRERGELVMLDSWLLPVTEVRLCAVVALST